LMLTAGAALAVSRPNLVFIMADGNSNSLQNRSSDRGHD
jgi:hypothetical protein